MGIYKAVISKNGFCPVVYENGFKCAYITHSEDYAFGKVSVMKRHNLTDEVFVLLSGRAIMLTLTGEEFVKTPLICGEALTVEKGTYHYLAVSEGARVFVCERDDTSRENTDSLTLISPYLIRED